MLLPFASQVEYKYWKALTAFVIGSVLIFRLRDLLYSMLFKKLPPLITVPCALLKQVLACLIHEATFCKKAICELYCKFICSHGLGEEWKKHESLLINPCCTNRLNFNQFKESTSCPEVEHQDSTSAGSWM